MTTPPTTTADLRRAAAASLDLVGHLLGNADRFVAAVRRDSAAVADESQRLVDAITRRAADLRSQVRATPRLTRLLTEGARVLASYRIHAARAPYLDAADADARLDALHRASAERLYQLCVELGGGVLKLGQFLSCRVDLLPAAYAEALARLQDQVPAADADATRAHLEAELDAPIESVFRAFDPVPLAAASLAQVHAAELLDGTRVAVKVQHPGIDDVLETDIAALRLLAATAGDALAALGDVDTVLAELSRSLAAELDFVAEAEACAEFRSAFAGAPFVTAPRIYAEHSSARVLVMERIDGERLGDFLARADAAPRDRLLATLVGSFCAQILEVGLFQADPHPGNFLVVDGDAGPELVVLDFGSAQRLEPEVRGGYRRLLRSLLARDRAALAASLAELGFASSDADALTEIAEAMLEPFTGLDLGTFDARAQIERTLALVRNAPRVTVPEHFVLVGRVLAALSGLVLGHRPAISLAAILAPHLVAA